MRGCRWQQQALWVMHGWAGCRADLPHLPVGRLPPAVRSIAYRSLFVDPAAAEEAAAAPKDEPGRAAPREQEQGWSETELLDHLLGRQGACAAATAAAAAHAAAGGASASQDASAAAAREDPQADAGGSLLASVAGALCLGWAPLAEFLAHLEVGAQEVSAPRNQMWAPICGGARVRGCDSWRPAAPSADVSCCPRAAVRR